MIKEHYEPEIQDEQYLNPFHTLKNSSHEVHKVIIWDVGGPDSQGEKSSFVLRTNTLQVNEVMS